jgi:hypothetical protein
MELIGEWPEARGIADTRCVATARCAMCLIIFLPTLHLRCMSLLLIVLDVIPQIQVGAEVVTEVTSRLLHFLVGTALSTMTTIVVYNTLASMTCAMPALLVASAPLISIMFASLFGIASSTFILETMHLIVHIVALVKIGASLLPGTSLPMTSGGRRRWNGCTPLVDLDCVRLQIILDNVKCWGFRELI